MISKDVVRLVFILLLHITIGRRLASLSSLHAVSLSKRLRRFLFIIDVNVPVISIAAIIWQLVVYATGVFSLVGFCIFDTDSFLRIFFLVAIFQWLFIAVPLFIYATISEFVLKRRFKRH